MQQRARDDASHHQYQWREIDIERTLSSAQTRTSGNR